MIHLPAYLKSALYLWTPPVVVMNPPTWPGEGGLPVSLTAEEQNKSRQTFALNEFNLVASDKVALNRTIPDNRASDCARKHYPPRLPDTSVIIVFYNEAWSTLLRTVHSIIRMTPARLLREIILVDDASDREHLGAKLDEYVRGLPVRVQVLRARNRSGLIQARLKGAKHAQGQVLTFLDAHCECNRGWLEPLLTRIAQDRSRVVCPIIDIIDDANFGYQWATEAVYGGFNWNLEFRWYPVSAREQARRRHDPTAPIR
jgi:polypeptide N-acetylgalactosaminyltransferase